MSKLNGDKVDNECIQVVVRCRPMNKKENDEKRNSIINVDCESRTVTIQNPDNTNEVSKTFTYDATYDDKTQQRVFYDESCFSVIEGTLEGFNSTIFAYGQTGCGKSFTMQGPSTTNDDLKGVIPNSFSHIFDFVKATKEIEFLIRCQYLELYNEEIKDLLTTVKNAPKLDLREDPQKGVYVNGITDVVVESAEDLNRMLDRGLNSRTTAATLMNAESSRSHSIFTIIIEMSTKDEMTGKDMLRVGKLNLVDLAGSERQKKTGAKDATLKEGIKINLSLSALGNVISALSEGANGRHIPYRDSKLTRLLQDSLGGNTKTMMIAAISPADYNFEETMSTLRYANRAKNIKNKPKINEDPKDAMIREFKEEIARLRSMLTQQAASSGMNHGNSSIPAIATQQLDVVSSSLDHHHQDSNPSPLRQIAPSNNSTNQSGKEIVLGSSPNPYSPDKDHYHQQQQSVQSGKERLDAENRLHQLEHLLVHHQISDSDVNGETKNSSSPGLFQQYSSPVGKQQQQSQMNKLQYQEVETEEQAAAARKYQEKRLESKKKKEAIKQREMQRILEEKKAIELELEELRVSQSNYLDNVKNTNSNMNDTEIEAMVMKKVNKLKKKYEKKLLSAQEEMADLREDFFYQRKQLIEAAMEQEKDSKLYEAICQSVLPDKELRKILDKCKYDEDADEWVLPFTKKKNVKDLVGYSSYAVNSGAGGGNSMLPDIFNKNTTGNTFKNDSKAASTAVHESMSSTLHRDPSYKTGGVGAGDNRMKSMNNKQSIVPLLTLPGNLVTSASLMDYNNYAEEDELYISSSSTTGGQGNAGSSPRWQQPSPLDSSRLQSMENPPNSGRPVVDIPKKNANKPKDYSNDGCHTTNYDHNNNNSNGYNSARVPTDPEAGNGLSAGPLDEWGFIDTSSNGKAGGYNGIGFNGPELEYYDDDDFENIDDIAQVSSSQQKHLQPYPPSNSSSNNNSSNQSGNKIRKKKKKASNNNNNDYTSRSLEQNTTKSSSMVTSLPPI